MAFRLFSILIGKACLIAESIFSPQKVNSKRILLFTCNDDPHVGNAHLQVGYTSAAVTV